MINNISFTSKADLYIKAQDEVESVARKIPDFFPEDTIIRSLKNSNVSDVGDHINPYEVVNISEGAQKEIYNLPKREIYTNYFG
jgi:hypothetical protein